MKRWLQFLFLLLTASALAHVPEPKAIFGLDDLNGNLTQAKNTLHNFAYDDENRLSVFTKYSSFGVPNTKSEFQYDGFSRLRVRKEYIWVPDNNNSSSPQRGAGTLSPPPGGGGTWQLNSETRYVYDGMRVLQERNGSNVPSVTYTRGKDLSGSLGGAGGIGGLLARSHGYSGGNWSTHNFYHADGGGNITYLLAANQTMAASYRYDPYGNTTYSSGSLAAANVYRFSSKELHLNSGLYAYGYRFYSPNWQRWLNQDPIGEWGGINLYEFVGNEPLNFVDPNGLLFKEQFKKFGDWVYDKMMGNGEGQYDPNGNLAQRTAMLGNEGADTLQQMMEEGAGLLGDQGTDALAGGAAGKVAGPLLGAVCKGGKKLLKPRLIDDAAKNAPVIIGENMNRVNAYAGKVGGETIDGWLAGRKWTQQLNDEFISTMKAQGRQFQDIGPDFGRRLQNRIDPSFGRPPSSVYGGERQSLLDYGNYQRLYDRTGKYQGGVPGLDP